jgi:peptidoglycan/xylan/chitin deacetylase (PgdA/CDA1 family)
VARTMMKRRILVVIYLLCSWTGIVALFYILNRKRRLILTYHNVIPDEFFDDALHLGVSHRVSEFRSQLDLIKSRFKVTTDFFSEDDETCIITFDDGYQNNVLAAHYLEQNGERGVFFIPVEPVISKKTLTIDRVLLWFSYVPVGIYYVAGETFRVVDGGRREAFSSFYAMMRHNIALWDKVPELLDACFPFADLKKLPERYVTLRFRPMLSEDLTRLRSAGHLIGCHSWNHRPLASLSDTEMRADFEACDAHNDLFNVTAYSYPFGDTDEIDERAIQLCKSFGYRVAVSNVSDQGPHNFMALPRESLPQEENRYILDAKLSGLESFIKRLIR